MKKLTLLFIALILVCSSVFATFSFTVGGGFGGKAVPNREAELIAGPGVFVGVDFTLKNGVTIYNDFEANYLLWNKVETTGTVDYPFYNLAEKVGAGYTLYKNDWSIMFGGGMELQMLFEKATIGAEEEEDLLHEFRLGIDTRIKATYNCSDRVGISVQTGPSIVFKALGQNSVVDKIEYSGNALVGFTFKY